MKKSTLAWIVVAVAAAIAGYFGLGRPGFDAKSGAGSGRAGDVAGAASAAASAPAQTVSVFVAQQRDVPVTVEAAGTVAALDTVDVRPQVAGTLAEVRVRDGQFVRRGDVLFRLDDRADRANLDRARAQSLRDQATLADLERQWQRAQELRAQNFIAQSAADTALASVEAQRAALAADQAAVRAAEVALSYDTIAAPLAGRAGAVLVYRGALVQPASSVLVNINQIDPIGVTFTVPETQLAALLGSVRGASGATVSVVIPDRDRNRDASPAAPLQGHVSFVDNAVDTTTGNIRVKATLANPAQALWPGQYVTVQMTVRTLAAAVVVPQAALIIRGNERSVYVVKRDSTVELRAVQTRLASGEFVVVDGVAPGERVVVEGKQNLRPGGALRATPYTPGSGRRGTAKGAPASAAQTASATSPAAPAHTALPTAARPTRGRSSAAAASGPAS